MTTLQELLATRRPLALDFTDEEGALFLSGHGWGDADDHAERGAAYLDRVLPGWAEHVAILDLDLGDTCRCVLGQLFQPLVPENEDPLRPRGWSSGYSAGLELLSLETLQNTLADGVVVNDAQFLGFDHTDENNYLDLTYAWQRLIEERTGLRAPQAPGPKPVF